MIKLDKDSNGIININNLNVNIDMFNPDRCGFNFVKDETRYFFKRSGKEETFKEIFASLVADKMGIEHANYDIATFGDNEGVVCNAVNKQDEEFISFGQIRSKLKISYRYDDSIDTMKKKILPKICLFNSKEELDKFINVFIFDILMANSDRNHGNTGFIKKGNNYRFSPLFDNEDIISSNAIDEHIYSFSVVNRKFDGLHHDTIIDFFNNKNYGYLLSDAIDNFNLEDLYDLVEEINQIYPNKFDKDYEIHVLSELKRNLQILKEYRYDYYNESKMLRR